MFKGRNAVLALLCLLLWSSQQLYGQSVLDFPSIISSKDVFTGIAITNPSSRQVSVTFTAYLPDGRRLSGDGIRNPVTVSLPPASQHARLFGEIFGAN